MEQEKLQDRAISLYQNNINYLKLNHYSLYEKITLFERAIDLGEYQTRFEIEVVDDYLDIYDTIDEKYIYKENSYLYSKKEIEKVNFSSTSNTFKTFYETEYSKDIIERIKNASILSSSIIGNAGVSHYIQTNTPNSNEMKNIYKCFVFGLGLGIHLDLLHKKLKSKKYVLIEPSLEIFRLSLFITNYETLSKDADINFAISLDENEFYDLIYVLSEETFLYDHYIKFFKFSQNCQMYIEIIQNFLVSQRHLLYSYDRALESFSRTYKYMSEGFSFFKLTGINMFEKPVLLLAAGPSLSMNIQFVKKNQNVFIVVAVYTLLPYLEEENIIPDIITQYDQQDEAVMKTISKIKNKSFFDKTIFLFASHLIDKLMNVFPKSRVFVFQALYKVKPTYGTLSSPSIGEITYGLIFHLGVKDIYLLGLDMSISNSGNTHIENHENSEGFGNISTEVKNNFTFRKNIITVKGNFLEEVNSLPLFKVSICALNDMLKYASLKNTKVYNLSDGAYFNNTLPTRISEINLTLMKRIDKKKFFIDTVTKFESISSNILSFEDKEYNKRKLEDAILMFKIVKKFHSLKYATFVLFKKSIFKLFNDVIYSSYSCDDLQDILLNFYKHNLPYLFHFFNLKDLNNPKKHIKNLNKLLLDKTEKIFIEYIDSIRLLLDKPKSF